MADMGKRIHPTYERIRQIEAKSFKKAAATPVRQLGE